MRQVTRINYEQSYYSWKRKRKKRAQSLRQKHAQAIGKQAWEYIARFKEAQALLRLVYRRADAKRQGKLVNPDLVLRDGVFQQRARRFLEIPTRHGVVMFKTNTRGLDTQRVRKKRNSILREVQVKVAWNTDTLPCSSDTIANEVNADIATYVSDTLKWGVKHIGESRLEDKQINQMFAYVCPLYGKFTAPKHNTKELESWQGTKIRRVGNRKNNDITG